MFYGYELKTKKHPEVITSYHKLSALFVVKNCVSMEDCTTNRSAGKNCKLSQVIATHIINISNTDNNDIHI